MPASAFFSVAEQSGLITDIDRWVFTDACNTAQTLVASGEAAASIDLHLNVSSSRLADARIAKDLEDALATSGIEPQRVVLEVSENAAFTAIHDSRSVVHAAKALGIRLALDDFGTGYSSLTYLNRFPVDVIKIHRLFVSGITQSLGETDLASAIVNMGLSLNLSVIAQGVERKDQLNRLREMGCPYAQGIILSEPLPLTTLKKLLRIPDSVTRLHSRAG
jgi:EAL domain-containing protein (putative c-di-GMP-specific phosphodiesterase class I)